MQLFYRNKSSPPHLLSYPIDQSVNSEQVYNQLQSQHGLHAYDRDEGYSPMGHFLPQHPTHHNNYVQHRPRHVSTRLPNFLFLEANLASKLHSQIEAIPAEKYFGNNAIQEHMCNPCILNCESDDSSKYRQLPCRTFVSVGTCPYRDRCVYLHDPRLISKDAKTKTRKKNKDDTIIDSLFWPTMSIVDVLKRTDAQRQPHVVQNFVVPEPKKGSPNVLHDLAIYSMWMHFTDTCAHLNGISISNISQEAGDSHINHHTGRYRLNIFFLLAEGRPLLRNKTSYTGQYSSSPLNQSNDLLERTVLSSINSATSYLDTTDISHTSRKQQVRSPTTVTEIENKSHFNQTCCYSRPLDEYNFKPAKITPITTNYDTRFEYGVPYSHETTLSQYSTVFQSQQEMSAEDVIGSVGPFRAVRKLQPSHRDLNNLVCERLDRPYEKERSIRQSFDSIFTTADSNSEYDDFRGQDFLSFLDEDSSQAFDGRGSLRHPRPQLRDDLSYTKGYNYYESFQQSFDKLAPQPQNEALLSSVDKFSSFNCFFSYA